MTNGVRQPALAASLAPPLSPPLAPIALPDGVAQKLPMHGDPHAPDPLTERQRSFAGVLAKAGGAGGPKPPEAQAREGAEQFVAISFLQPLLKQLRETNRASAPFAPTAGEKQMQGLMDAELAGRLAKAQRWPLVDRIAQDLLRKSAEKAGPEPLEKGR